MADIIAPGIPGNTVSLATASAQGAMSVAQNNKLAAVDNPKTGVVPAFAAGAASVAPGTDNAIRYVVEATRTLAQASAITLATTGAPVVGNKLVLCKALALGYPLAVVNGGPLAGTVATIEASLTVPKGAMLWWDGTNYSFNGYVHTEVD